MNGSILVVDDDRQSGTGVASVIERAHFDVVNANPDNAFSRSTESTRLVVCDLPQRKSDGLNLLRHWTESKPQIPFVMVCGTDCVESIVDAMRFGARDCFRAPIDKERLVNLVGNCLEQFQSTPPERPGQLNADGLVPFVGSSPAMHHLYYQIHKVAPTDSTVLITGESGTGKELVANSIHRMSKRREQELVTINMSAVPEHLVESELFGHKKGAFTGATDSRMGRFEMANAGTLFIDEIGDFRIDCQAKLLRVLEDQRVTPVGSSRSESLDVRVIAATNHDLATRIDDGKFRADLFYRLNVVHLRIPPLRQRKADIPLLVEHFLELSCERLGRPVPQIAQDLSRFLEEYDWPGNVRQLRNCIESMVVLAEGDEISLKDLPESLCETESSLNRIQLPVDRTLDEIEKLAIRQELEVWQGSRTDAAKALGISVRTLQRKLKLWREQNRSV